WTELGSGNKDAYSCWPPSSACGPGSWFSKKWLQWDADLRMIREHHCTPSFGTCSLDQVPFWAGVELLTPPAAGQQVTLAAWNYAPGAPARDQDVERYALMTAGTVQDLTAPELLPGSGDP